MTGSLGPVESKHRGTFDSGRVGTGGLTAASHRAAPGPGRARLTWGGHRHVGRTGAWDPVGGWRGRSRARRSRRDKQARRGTDGAGVNLTSGRPYGEWGTDSEGLVFPAR